MIISQISADQCWDCPSCRPKTMRNMARPLRNTPSRSNRCRSVGNVGISQAPTARPITPMGTLTKKIHAQPRWSMMTPPASGPTSVATPAVAPHTLIATPRR